MIEWLNIHPGIMIAALLLIALFKPNKVTEDKRQLKKKHGRKLNDLFISFSCLFYSRHCRIWRGPFFIPLVEHEVVTRYQWMTVEEFSEVLALEIPYLVQSQRRWQAILATMLGVLGAIVAVLPVVPSLILMIALLGILYKYKDSPKVKNMTSFVRPTIAVLLGILAIRFIESAYIGAGMWQTIFLVVLVLFFREVEGSSGFRYIWGLMLWGDIFSIDIVSFFAHDKEFLHCGLLLLVLDSLISFMSRCFVTYTC